MKDIKYYMNLPYTKSVQEINDESGHYFYGKILELDGCQSTGDTEDIRCGKFTGTTYLNRIGNIIYFGLTDILLVVQNLLQIEFMV